MAGGGQRWGLLQFSRCQRDGFRVQANLGHFWIKRWLSQFQTANVLQIIAVVITVQQFHHVVQSHFTTEQQAMCGKSVALEPAAVWCSTCTFSTPDFFARSESQSWYWFLAASKFFGKLFGLSSTMRRSDNVQSVNFLSWSSIFCHCRELNRLIFWAYL